MSPSGLNLRIHHLHWKKFDRTGAIPKSKYGNRDSEETIRAYTYLSNVCFKNHPYLSTRDYSEDYELFEPMKNLTCDDNLIVAEYREYSVGFWVWFPDSNQLPTSNQIDTLRIPAVSIVEDYQKKAADLALAKAFVETIKDLNFEFCGAGFIFRENTPGMNLTQRYLHRFLGVTPEVSSEFAIYETEI